MLLDELARHRPAVIVLEFADPVPDVTGDDSDSREALTSAYGRILRVSDPSRRAALIAELANLPIEMSDVATIRAERKKIEKEGVLWVCWWKGSGQRISSLPGGKTTTLSIE